MYPLFPLPGGLRSPDLLLGRAGGRTDGSLPPLFPCSFRQIEVRVALLAALVVDVAVGHHDIPQRLSGSSGQDTVSPCKDRHVLNIATHRPQRPGP